ncbi:malate dehydrogenase [Myroides pelagicus]|uniref:Malate dehydrogenase n=1 Tax=Myroides pelagicus TaxID=270914 RepID=A0A7K1GGY3_9FLAO|nr:malate dehydrogenase [Myroides pelagicus]MEC4113488.1 malate dehydrogenase [Myroides pelagicus]MTH28325.1 malate dehydrogenase [Myroides pelagicus]
MKVSVIGAGNVGATCAEVIANKQIASEVVLVDIVEGYAEGKAMDIMQCAATSGFGTVVSGATNQYEKTANSNVIVITSGIPRKPGMTREELIGTNASIVKTVINNSLKYSPEAIFVIVTNPLDTMALAAMKVTGLPKNRIIGMGGALDSSRFRYFLSQKFNKPIADIEGMVVGGHGDTTMIPLTRFATYKGIPLSTLVSEEELEEVAKQTMVGGATLTKLLGTSAWYAPGASVAYLVDSILSDRKRMIPCSAYLEGEYGKKDLFIGVPCVIGKNGIEKIVELSFNELEQSKFDASVEAILETNKELTNFLS